MKKKKILIISAVLIVVLICALVTGLVLRKMRLEAEEAERLRIYHETYLVMDGAEYLRASTELDLSGRQITELEKLTELSALQTLDLRDTGISIAQYDMLHEALPNCQIRWSVPFQGCYCDSDTQELTVETLSQDDLAVLAYFPV